MTTEAPAEPGFRRSLFWAGWGLTAFFFQLPLTRMVLDDAQTLFLGNWDWLTFGMLCGAAYLLIPLAAGLALAAADRLSPRAARAALAFSAAYLLSVQVQYFVLNRAWGHSKWTDLAALALFCLAAALVHRAYRFSVEFFKTCVVIGLGAFLLFAYRAAPSRAARLAEAGAGAPAPAEPGLPPVFFLTFEKLAAPYFADENGTVSAREFPNVARFVSEADYYPNTYANSVATVFALQSLYAGREVRKPWGWSPPHHLREVLGRGRKTIMLLDLLDYCDSLKDTCIKSVGVSGRSRLDLVAGWHKTFLRTITPQRLSGALGLVGWKFNPWEDMWEREGEQASAEVSAPVRAGTRQLRLLTEILEREGAAPNLYVMHNWISDGPKNKISDYLPGPREGRARELRETRRRLAVFDAELGKLISFLKKRGIYERALILVTADTGYDPGINDAKPEPSLPSSPELLKVLLAIKRPGQARGRVLPGVLRQIDVLPTIVKDLGMDPGAYGFEGVPVVDPRDRSTLTERPLGFFMSIKAGFFSYRLDGPGGPLRR